MSVLDEATELIGTRGFDAWELFHLERDVRLVKASGGKSSVRLSASDRGMGIRVAMYGRSACASTTDLSERGLSSTLLRLTESVLSGSQDPYFVLPSPPADGSARPAGNGGPAPPSWDGSAATTRVLEAEAAALRADPRIRGVSNCYQRVSSGRVAVRNSRGTDAAFGFCRASLLVECTAEEGGTRKTASYALFGNDSSGLDPAAVGAEAGRRAASSLGAKGLIGGRYNAVLSPESAAHLMSRMAPYLSGAQASDGASPWKDLVGDAVGTAQATILDAPALPGSYGFAAWDAEGTPAAPLVLVDKGILKGFAHNSETAARMGVRSTGHAVRSDCAFPPGVGFHNLHLACTGASADDVLSEAGEGLYVEDLWLQPDADIRKGLFTFNVRGRMIRSGERSDPIDGVLVTEHLPRLLLKLRLTGRDLAWGPRGTAGSTTFLEKVVVS